MIKFVTSKFMTISIIILLQQNLVFSKCSCENQVEDSYHKVSEALKYKLIAMATVFVSSLIGVCIPIFAKKCSYLNPENDFYFLVKAFAAGVILATGFIHILPDAFEALTSPCISEKPWKLFPFSGFVTMVAAIGTLIMEALIMGYHKRSEMKKAQPLDENDETHHSDNGSSHVHNFSIASDRLDSTNRLRYTIVSQILELGIVLHSVILGISLGVSRSPKTIKPLVAVLTFHQCFEGIGLGGCISQAQFKYYKVTIMILFFCLIFPIGIGIGMGISNIYNESSPKSLIVEGFLLSASAGVLINMALVDLVATDFMNSKMLTNFRLQLGASLALFVGMICMSILALGEDS
ncbi:putative zinc/iron permease [Medicago truncatula]|uniref:Putative zinc/iron permease n=1 Tax=Medicago truncatula TaxID=3880 RepID=B7FK77_MEDTR|nr:probable zinc transporter 12 [Medicago truncatula]ACJ85162.1 unknown [Medicago truncatula]AFK34276.1 unknown [Medicago truncatula]KEH24870.1 ZIP zinc/iron transport family protein [Medicago truncatula]RHN49852.1 putative zinc/iron permease [Medicago truncatula]